MIVSEGSGSVTLNGIAMASPEADQSFGAETVVTLRAVPAPGFGFLQWGGQVVSQDNPLTIGVNCSQTETVIFTRLPSKLTMKQRGRGWVSPSPGDHAYGSGEKVWITASAGAGWRFAGWKGAVDNPRSMITSVIMDSDVTVTARFLRRLPAWLIPAAVLSDILVLGAAGWWIFRDDLPRRLKEPDQTQ